MLPQLLFRAFSLLVQDANDDEDDKGKGQRTRGPRVTQDVTWSVRGSVDLTRDDTSEVGESELRACRGGFVSGRAHLRKIRQEKKGHSLPKLAALFPSGATLPDNQAMLPPVHKKQAVAIRKVAKYLTPADTSSCLRRMA